MRKAGILLAVSSLPSRHGIGDFGRDAREFVKMTKSMGFKIWQILPINPVGYGNSPYQPFGSKPFDELYINLDYLVAEKLLDDNIPNYFANRRVTNYDKVRKFKLKYLRRAFNTAKKGNLSKFNAWVKENSWVYNYAVFITFKKANNLIQWHYWPKAMREWIREQNVDLTPYTDDINFEMWLQYKAYDQWQSLKAFANDLGIEIMGDIPIYVGIDSIDVWENPRSFMLDENYFSTFVAGVPGDYFNADGQLWGNPLYNWDYLEKTKFLFWIDRLGYSMKLYDYIRIDHFRAFDSYWKIPADSPKATLGEWAFPPGYALFDEIYKKLPTIKIVAEDLGDLRPEVLELRDHYNLPGMEISSFTFNPFEPQGDWPVNRLIYPGTHDNSPIRGWFGGKDKKFMRAARQKLRELGYHDYRSFYDNFIAYNFGSDAKYCIIPMQDILRYGEWSKMNSPSTIGSPNWEWKMVNFNGFKEESEFLKTLIKKYNR